MVQQQVDALKLAPTAYFYLRKGTKSDKVFFYRVCNGKPECMASHEWANATAAWAYMDAVGGVVNDFLEVDGISGRYHYAAH